MEPKETAIARQRLGKHALAAMDTHATMDELLEAVFIMRSMPRLYKEGSELVSGWMSESQQSVPSRGGGGTSGNQTPPRVEEEAPFQNT
jgi:hypothetical protein